MHNTNRDYVVEYHERSDSVIAARFLFGVGVTWLTAIVFAISQSVN